MLTVRKLDKRIDIDKLDALLMETKLSTLDKKCNKTDDIRPLNHHEKSPRRPKHHQSSSSSTSCVLPEPSYQAVAY